jgi:C-terminal processing protease CtpA/Prc
MQIIHEPARRWRGVTSTVCLVALLVLAPAARTSGAEVDAETLLREAWTGVRRDFVDPDLKGIDWPEVLESYLPRARRLRSALRTRELVNEMLAELGASHTALLEERAHHTLMAELAARPSLQGGCELEWRDAGFFVRSMHEGGPAARSGLRLGDRVVLVDGERPEASGLVFDAGYDPGLPGAPIFYILPDDGSEVRLRVQSTTDPQSLRDVVLEPEKIHCVEVARRSVRVIEAEGYRLGFIHFWFLPARGLDTVLRDALRSELRGCDGLIVDLRGRGGYDHMGRSVERLLESARSRFRGGVVALIDERTRSAKELLADRLQRHGSVTLVGTHTEGAVIGAKFRKLSDGSVLMIGGYDVCTDDGRRLEGVGVEPDVEVGRAVDDYAGGRDRILDKGIGVLIERCRKKDPRWVWRPCVAPTPVAAAG